MPDGLLRLSVGPRGRRRPLGRPDAGHPARRRERERARGMLRAMEPDSLLVRGLVDNPSGGLSPALDRSTTFERAAGRRLALRSRARAGRRGGRGAAGRARGRRGDALRERHDGLDVPLPHGARAGQGARDPDERLLRGRVARLGGARALRRRGAPLRPARCRGLPPRLRRRGARDHRDAVQPDAHGHRHRGRGGRPRTPAGRCSAATTRSGRRSCSARSTSAPTSPGRAPRSTSRATPTCSQA